MGKFEIYKDQAGEFRWRFKASNHEVIAVSSEGYKTKYGCEHGIALIQREGPDAEIGEKRSPVEEC